MKGPNDFKEELSEEDLKMVSDLEAELGAWFENGHDEMQINIITPGGDQGPIPHRVAEEFVIRARKAGWIATLQGAMLIVKMPRRV